jgi:putative transposase
LAAFDPSLIAYLTCFDAFVAPEVSSGRSDGYSSQQLWRSLMSFAGFFGAVRKLAVAVPLMAYCSVVSGVASAKDDYTSEQFHRLMADHGVVCSMSRSGNVWDNAAMESFFSSLKTERTARKMYRTRNDAKADVFDYIERFYNPKRRHSTIGYLSPMEFERQAGLA